MNTQSGTVDSRYNKLLGRSEILLYSGCKNNEIQRNVELWDQQNYLVISGFFYIRILLYQCSS